MDSDLQHQQYHRHFQGLQREFQLPRQQMNTGGGLTRYRSAPSSYFSNFMETVTATGAADFSQPRPLSPETETILARFVQSVAGETDSTSSHKVSDVPDNSLLGQSDFMMTVKQETEQFPNNSINTGYSSSSSSHQTIYHSSNKPPLARRTGNSMGGLSCGMESNFRVPSSIGMDFLPSHMKREAGSATGVNNSTLTRHRSSPAGLFDDIIIENGYLVSAAGGTGNYGSSPKRTKKEDFSSPVSGLNDKMNFPSSSTGMLATNTDAGDMSMSGDGNFISNFPVDSWDDSSIFSDQFTGSEGHTAELNPSENQNKVQNEGGGVRPPGLLAHHLSLPKASLEKLLQLQDSVPCQLRAKRGCATHPRSIAERVRRTKISERMRKLQDLVPNMDKQTNTADMLDLAVDYIKDLQTQIKTLANKRARCTCTI